MSEDPSHQSIEFLTTWFLPRQLVLHRFIESWTENGRKRSRVDYDANDYVRYGVNCGGEWKPVESRLTSALARMSARAAEQNTNHFFSVCPREGHKDFDLDFQIRVANGLWSDIDHVSVDQAIQNIVNAGLPPPSIVINSGNGVHAYWLFDQPYQIDDCGPAPRTYDEWPEQSASGKKKGPRKYLLGPAGERLYLDKPANRLALSQKAQSLQDALQGVAAAIGGDHTHDPTRILRLPGTSNRKDQRNGKEPVPCVMIYCERDTRYPFETFLPFADKAPAKLNREKIARVQLPTVKAKISAGRADRLSQLVAACDAAPIGQRSDADFALCCWAIENGVDSSEVWARVENIGKFAEAGHAYFQRTWAKAEGTTRERIFAKAEKSVSKSATFANAAVASDDPESNSEKNLDPDDIGLTKALADTITGAMDCHFARDASGRLFVYRDGAYRPKGERVIHQRVKALLHLWEETKAWTPLLGDAVAAYIAVDAPELWNKPPLDVICVKNGLLSIADRKLNDHSPDWLSTVQLPIAYDAKACCPEIDLFVEQVFPEDAHSLAYEIPAWLMTPMVSIQKAVLLLGPGGDGKSTYIALLLAFIGHTNASNLSLHRLESDRFSVGRLMGKLLNACPDLPSEHLAGTSTFKSITGGDRMTGEHKFHDSFEFESFVRLVFSANHPPRSNDGSAAFFRRWLPIPFTNTFDGTPLCLPREVLDAKLSAPGELSGLLNRALDALPGLKQRNDFSSPASVIETLAEFRAVTDPLAMWLTKNVVTAGHAYVACGDLRDAYNRDAGEKGRPMLTATAFGLALRKFKADIEIGQRTVNGRVQKCYLGLGLAHTTSPGSPGSPLLVSRTREKNCGGQASYYEAGM